MKVTIYLSDGATLDFESFNQESALDLAQGLSEQTFATFEMDGATVLVNVGHIVRVDIE